MLRAMSTIELASVCRPCTLISIWTFVSCVRGLLSLAHLNMRTRATLREVVLLLRISTHKQEPQGALIAHLSSMSTNLFKVRFLSKWLIRKHDCHICEISPNSKQSGYFNSGYEDAFGLLLLHSDLKKKSSKEGTPHWPIFVPPWIHLWADLAKKPERMCRAMITSSLPSLVNIHQSVL